ncbi:LON peptidase substrate-binding domain-containing protein [Algimonas porphyrae]|uniref:ATP-dependent protease n=1 Tax=Algimonas porphyrae TaxID=1128113 RepID=A0ABQ5V171_9PROT|nr:LON peptidase substrate-binding domain-containing protein [Algimonas porphyrae]GLQ20919.1 ATP-dependent protease [Algimonas porphyrae]
MSAHYKSLARRTTPSRIPIFPLSGAVLLPVCDLPLNIFEPRYLNMIDDALKTDRLIGMVQSVDEDENGTGIADVGGLGRIIQFSETDDGRYLIVLKGLRRFRITDLPNVATPYRQADITFDPFPEDPDLHAVRQTSEALSESGRADRAALTVAMKALAKAVGVEVDWKALAEIPLPILVNQAAMISPFSAPDKQSLLEAQTSDERRRLLIGLMHLYASGGMGDATHQNTQ